MMLPSLDNIVQWVSVYKYSLLFPVAVVEGPIISVIAGFLAASHLLNLWVAYTVLVLGDLAGDSLYYLIGFWGGEPFIRRWGHMFGLSINKLIITEQAFKNHPKKLLFFGKTQAWGSLILTAAGIVKMPYGKFLRVNFIGTTLKSAVLVLIGYYAVRSYVAVDRDLKYLGISMTILSATFIIVLILWRKYRHVR